MLQGLPVEGPALVKKDRGRLLEADATRVEEVAKVAKEAQQKDVLRVLAQLVVLLVLLVRQLGEWA